MPTTHHSYHCTMTRIAALLGLALLLTPSAHAQPAKADTAKAAPPIADNSFLMEEAYNQESGVVQHINAFDRTRDGFWVYAFTQEWPAPSQRHQLSYTVPVVNFGAKGIGDLGLNYRYQAIGADGEKLWVSPRLSVYLPTGDESSGRGAGGPGVEVNLPVSYALSDAIVTHWNAGVNLTRLRGSGVTGSSRGVRVGASAIWLVTPTFNLMLESVAGRTQVRDGQGGSETSNSFVISPGMRGAINFASGLQVVPGIAFPVGAGPSSGQRDVFLYLSLEHPFR
jgi:hypothetical protein